MKARCLSGMIDRSTIWRTFGWNVGASQEARGYTDGRILTLKTISKGLNEKSIACELFHFSSDVHEVVNRSKPL